MYRPQNETEARLIAALASGDESARAPYSDQLESSGEADAAAFLRFDPHKLNHEWLAAIGWTIAGIDLVRAPSAVSSEVRRLLFQLPDDLEILQMASPSWVAPSEQLMIVNRPQRAPFRPQRILIADAADWMIDDIKIGNRSQLPSGVGIPGHMFTTYEIDRLVAFEPCQTAMDFVMTVTYIGTRELGAQFFAWVVGPRRGPL